MRPVALAFLAKNAEGLHGYLLAQKMGEVLGTAPDTTGLYRLLREMECAGYLDSSLGESTDGPAPRVYALTPKGRTCLATWTLTLLDHAARVERIAELCAEAS